MTMGVDLSAVTRRQIPILLDKMVTAPVFIAGRSTNYDILNNRNSFQILHLFGLFVCFADSLTKQFSIFIAIQ